MVFKSDESCLNLKNNFKAYSIAIIISILFFMLFSTVYVLSGYINNKVLDLTDHSVRILFGIFIMVAYGVFLLTIEVYVIVGYIKTKMILKEKITIKDIIFLIILHLSFSIYQIIVIITMLLEIRFVLLILTLLLLLPYFYLIVKKITINGKKENKQVN